MGSIRNFRAVGSNGLIKIARKRAEYALRSSEAKLAGILAIAGDAIVSIDAERRINLFNEAAERMFGYAPAEVLGQPIEILIPTRFHATHQRHIERFAAGSDIARRMGERQEVVGRRKNGEEFPTEASISKLDVGGERFYTVVLRDVTERKRAEYALRSSEAKLAGILAIAGDAIVSIDSKHRINLFNEAAERMFGYSPAEVLRQPIDILIPTRFHATHQRHIERFAAGSDIARRMGERQEVVGRRKNGEEFPTEASISKLDVGGERFYTVVLRDVTERKRAEKHQGQLVAELDHRVKNVLARVAAVAMYTGLGSGTKEELLHTLDGRIQSLADAHVLLSDSRWQGVGLADLVHHQVAPYTNADNTTIEGPKVLLTAAATEAVAMVLYELVTNAVKYGALSTPQGRVVVTWAGGSNGRVSEGIVIKWRETGGPLVTPPKRSGYGTSLIRDLIPHEIGGAVDLAFTADGVTCKIKLPSVQLTNRDQ